MGVIPWPRYGLIFREPWAECSHPLWSFFVMWQVRLGLFLYRWWMTTLASARGAVMVGKGPAWTNTHVIRAWCCPHPKLYHLLGLHPRQGKSWAPPVRNSRFSTGDSSVCIVKLVFCLSLLPFEDEPLFCPFGVGHQVRQKNLSAPSMTWSATFFSRPLFSICRKCYI